MTIDTRTGRPYGDHGTAVQAIDWILNHSGSSETDTFLRSWMHGDLDEWPEFYAWLAKQNPSPEMHLVDHNSMNEWFLSLPKERQRILRDNKWMLAENAFRAGRLAASETKERDK